MKIISLIAAIAIYLNPCIAIDQSSTDEDININDYVKKFNFKPMAIDQSIYTDTILSVYNSTCIETANWKYVFINNTSLTQEDIYKNIFVSEIRELGDKALLADIFL